MALSSQYSSCLIFEQHSILCLPLHVEMCPVSPALCFQLCLPLCVPSHPPPALICHPWETLLRLPFFIKTPLLSGCKYEQIHSLFISIPAKPDIKHKQQTLVKKLRHEEKCKNMKVCFVVCPRSLVSWRSKQGEDCVLLQPHDRGQHRPPFQPGTGKDCGGATWNPRNLPVSHQAPNRCCTSNYQGSQPFTPATCYSIGVSYHGVVLPKMFSTP